MLKRNRDTTGFKSSFPILSTGYAAAGQSAFTMAGRRGDIYSIRRRSRSASTTFSTMIRLGLMTISRGSFTILPVVLSTLPEEELLGNQARVARPVPRAHARGFVHGRF